MLRQCSHACPCQWAPAGDLTLFWAIDGGVEMIKLCVDYGADLNARHALRQGCCDGSGCLRTK